MIEETATSGYECTEEIEIPVSISHGSVGRSRDDTDGKSSGDGKRRRCGGYEEEEDVFQLRYRSRRDVDVNFRENVVFAAVSGASDHLNSSVVDSMAGDSISDLEAVEAKFLPETDIFNSSNEGFSRETSTSSVICLESEEMESSSTSTEKTPAIEATSRRKPVPAAETMPSAAELEEFFTKAEKYEQKRFAEKYNFDIVKDVPMDGRYQWIPLPLNR
ncbi:hypothetical protein SSX86_024037 [Deinandra increscens subsp. villosa]|uniref:Cyclin-dependent kinase inhibitor domain-containing protein n=1 Tax=Deinandra increscens subsp. villosa TaxID=3103831 RepID=A0AAP0CMD3_9ASTR